MRSTSSNPFERYAAHYFITAKNTVADLASGFEARGNDFLSKPVAVSELTLRVKTHLQTLDAHRSLTQLVSAQTQALTLAHSELTTLDEKVSDLELKCEELEKVRSQPKS